MLTPIVYKKTYRWLFLLCLWLPAAQAEFLIETIAGSEIRGYSHSNEGNLATVAMLAYPHDVAVDNQGNVYIADTYNHRIRQVDNQGIITTIAGDGNEGFGGDGQTATLAQLNNPEAIALDNQGHFYIADRDNHRIRKLDAQGILTTVAGDGNEGYSGDGGLAVEAQLNDPVGISIDSQGNLYIADMDNHRIRKVDTQGMMTTVAGNGLEGYSGDGALATQAQLNRPQDVAVDEQGQLYIADTHNHCIRKIDSQGMITTIVGTAQEGYSGDYGPAIKAKLNDPEGIVLDKAGNLYITDMDNHRIRKVDARGSITTIAGNGQEGFSGDGATATQAQLNNPEGIAVDDQGQLYIADTQNHRIRQLTRVGPKIRIDKTTLIF
ncbi:MAG: NHL repeat-containing protein [Pseudomonadota bacterium]|nr:NHL repeat-containing protein [Pseudomonadota bacterium]